MCLMWPRRDDCVRSRTASCFCLAAAVVASPDACACSHRPKPFELLAAPGDVFPANPQLVIRNETFRPRRRPASLVSEGGESGISIRTAPWRSGPKVVT